MPLQLRLTLLVGPTVAAPAPPVVVEALDKVEVTHTDEGRSGFQLTFTAGRGGIIGLMDYPLVMLPLLKPFNSSRRAATPAHPPLRSPVRM
jgi:hypothetical protein